MRRRTVVNAAAPRPISLPVEPLEPRRLLATVTGVVFNDLNGNGIGELGEPSVAGVPVYVDLDNDAQLTPGEPTATSTTSGYRVEGVPIGTHFVRIVAGPGAFVTTTPSGAYSVTIFTDSHVAFAGDFGRYVYPTFDGQVYHDFNGDGRRGADEFGLPGWRAFGDRNNNGAFDPEEPSTLTDVEGVFHLAFDPGPRHFTVRLITPEGWAIPVTSNARLIDAASGNRFTFTFAQYNQTRIRGRLLFDTAADRNLTNEPPLGARQVYVDVNDDGILQPGEPTTTTDADGNYGFAVPPGAWVVRPVKLPGDVVTEPPYGGILVVTVAGGPYEALAPPLGINRTGPRGGLYGYAFDDRNRNAAFDVGEAPAPGRVIYIDANGNSQLDAAEQSVTSDSSGFWGFPEKAAGTYVLRQVVPAGWTETVPAEGARVAAIVNATHVVKNLDFGAAEERPTAVVRRSVFYNASNIDETAALTPADDRAIDAAKTALLPGQTATLSNITSYTRGINGIMIDVARLPAGTTLSLSDFVFKAGTSPDPSTWADAPAPTALSVRRGGALAGPDRVALTWPEAALRNTWLQVTLRATPATGLSAPDVFYFGNLVGAATPSAGARQTVGALDYLAVRRAAAVRGRVVSSAYDHNRDGVVNALDVAAVRLNLGRSLPLLGA